MASAPTIMEIRIDTSRVTGGLGIARGSVRSADWMEQTAADRRAVVAALEADDARERTARSEALWWALYAVVILLAVVAHVAKRVGWL